jgi:DNA-binding response OmpR family regulator
VTDETPALPPGEEPLTVLVYSDDPSTRRRIILAIGPRPAQDLPHLEFREVATEPVVHKVIGAGGIDLAILDGEAWPAGGMGICRQLQDEQPDPPPVLVVIGRADDRWLATWSMAAAVVTHPVDPPTITREVLALLRADRDRLPVR